MCRTPEATGQAIIDLSDGDRKNVVALRLNEGSTRRLIYIVDDRNNGGRAYGMTLCVNLMKAWLCRSSSLVRAATLSQPRPCVTISRGTSGLMWR